MKPFSYKEYKYKGIIFLYIFYFPFLETLNGKVVALQNGTSQHLEPHHVSTGEETHLVVHFHDPDHFLDQAQEIIFYWFVLLIT